MGAAWESFVVEKYWEKVTTSYKNQPFPPGWDKSRIKGGKHVRDDVFSNWARCQLVATNGASTGIGTDSWLLNQASWKTCFSSFSRPSTVTWINNATTNELVSTFLASHPVSCFSEQRYYLIFFLVFWLVRFFGFSWRVVVPKPACFSVLKNLKET